MYEAFYRLQAKPFQLSPDPRFFFSSRGHRRAMAYLVYGAHQGEGFIVITGEIGAGKTMLAQTLAQKLASQNLVLAQVVSTRLSADDMVRMVATAFGLPKDDSKALVLDGLEQFLLACSRQGKRALLIVDEAQNLPMGSVEELRMLSNFQIGQTTLLQSFLIGQPQFRPIMSSPDLEQLRQRVIASYHLGPLTQDETKSYIEHRLITVGWQQDPAFAPGTMEAIYQRTEGVPRKINTLCSRLLLFGCLESRHTIEPIMVDQVSEELAQELYGTSDSANAPVPKFDPEPARPAPVERDAGDVRQMEDLTRRIATLEAQFGDHDKKLQQTVNIMSKLIERL